MNLIWHRPPRRWPRLRNLRASIRDTLVLVNEFKGTLAIFSGVLLVGGWLYWELSIFAGDHSLSPAEAVFVVLSMMFLQAQADFPDEWFRQLFFFIMPVSGLALLAGGADFGVLLFNRRLRGEAWQVAVTSTYSDHIVLIGLGHLGFRVVRELHRLGDDVVAVELDPGAELLAEARALGIPIIKADATKLETLKDAGVERASAIILCTSNDAMNLQIAIKARNLNSKARVLVRLFDEDFAAEIQNHFGIDEAFSASALAAPAIAGLANESDVSSPISIAGRALSLARIAITAKSALAGLTIDQFENQFDATVVLLERNGQSLLHPHNDTVLAPGDGLAIFAEPKTLVKITRANRS